MTQQKYATQMVTPTPVRGSFMTNVFVAKKTDRTGDDGKDVFMYQCQLLIPKADVQTVNLMNGCIEQAKLRGAAEEWGGMVPPQLKLPLRDGDSPFEEKSKMPEYKGMWFLNASAAKQPGVIDQRGSKILSYENARSGWWYLADINFYPFKRKGNTGIAVGINNFMLVRQDTELGGGTQSPEEAFKAFIQNAGANAGGAAGGFL